jgi:hypothetical protein
VSELLKDANDWVLDALTAVVRDGENHRILLDRELQRAGGGTMSLNLTVLPLTGVAHETVGSMLVFEDGTREKRIRGTMVRFMSDTVVDNCLDWLSMTVRRWPARRAAYTSSPRRWHGSAAGPANPPSSRPAAPVDGSW